MSIRFLVFFYASCISLFACGGGGSSGGTSTPVTPASSVAASSAAPSSVVASSSSRASSSSASSVTTSLSSSVAALSLCTKLSTPDNGDGSGTETGTACRLRTGFDITGAMGLGWNLGNTMDATGNTNGILDETYWGNTKTTQENLNALSAAGFTTLRLPVSWDDHTGATSEFTINTQWMDRVEEIANYAITNNMYVIINIHHNDGWESITTASETAIQARLIKLWAQIATKFKQYDHHVIFETMNEPRNMRVISDGGDDDWQGTDSDSAVINRLNAAALNAIRATGGNNARRLVMLPGYAASADDRPLTAIVMPNDKMIALSAHSYSPYNFALNQGQNKTITFTDADKTTLDEIFSRLDTKFVQKGIPVVMGEWGALDKNNLSERVKHATYFSQKARAKNIPIVYWDNGVTDLNSEAFGLLNRANNTWYFPTLLAAMKTGWGI